MAGLLDFLDNPGAQGLLAAVAAGMAGARRGAPINAIGSGLLGGLQGYNTAKDIQSKNQMQGVQLKDIQGQADLRNAQLAQMKRQQAYLEQLMGNGPSMPSAQTALSSGASVGDVGPTVGNAQRMNAIQPQPMRYGIPSQAMTADMAINGGKNIPDWMFKRGTPDMKVQDGYAYDANSVQPGFMPGMHISQNGQASLVTVGPDGKPRVSLPNGAATTQAANVIASELPKAMINSGFRREDFPNPDGTTRSITGLQFANDAGGVNSLMNMLGQLDGSQPIQSQPTPTPTPQPTIPKQTPQSMVIPARVQKQRDADRIAILQAELGKATDPNDQAAIRRELYRAGAGPSTKVQSTGGGIVSGMNTQQQADAAAQKAGATKQAEANVQPIETRRNTIANFNHILSTIDNVANHPGLSEGTGLQGLIDPRNYIPGTQAKDFQVAASQLHGEAFLGAYERLRGSGQISNTEGEKAEDALARLSTAQTTDSYKKALSDFRNVITGALQRAQLAMPAGVPTQFPGDMAPNNSPSTNSKVIDFGSLR